MAKVKCVKIRSFPRIHMSLLDMNGSLGRINGGIGFAINSPCNLIEFTSSDKTIVEISKEFQNGTTLSFISNLIEKIQEEFGNINSHIKATKLIPVHYGFGSRTSLALSIAEGMLLCNDFGVSRETMIKISGRGNTSGIGINTYFDGKFIFDLGHSIPKGLKNHCHFMPSFRASFKGIPPVLLKKTLPKWNIICCVPDLRETREKEEVEFFKSVCPLPKVETSELVRFVVMGLIPAVLEENYALLCRQINKLQTTVWKSSEINRYESKIWDLMSKLRKSGMDATGMSSMGPMIYCFSKRLGKKLVAQIKKDLSLKMIFLTTPRNSGRELTLL